MEGKWDIEGLIWEHGFIFEIVWCEFILILFLGILIYAKNE